ncbi:MAG: XdhC family protein [Anaerolineales bacterium]|jgi:xanthine dehydrogenase accessory factor
MLDVLEKAQEFRSAGQPFAIATVVWVERPTSAKPGAKAIITEDGELAGWVGGSCAEPTVRREARKALGDGEARLVRICPPEKRGTLPQEGVHEVTMTCVSGGTLEIFIEPFLVQPQLVIIGHQAIAQALASLGKDMGYPITVLGLEANAQHFPRADRLIPSLDYSQLQLKSNACVIVASHGNYDEEALEAALQMDVAYVALVASKSRAQAVLEYLRESGMPEERLQKVKYPAGLDVGAITPEEIALSILAEIVQRRRRVPGGAAVEAGAIHEDRQEVNAHPQEEAFDPVCGMTVEIATAQFKTDYNGQTYYFCARGCQRSFEAEPEKYLVTT